MGTSQVLAGSRRRFLRYLALSPGWVPRSQSEVPCGRHSRRIALAVRLMELTPAWIAFKSVEQVLEVMEFETLARKVLPPLILPILQPELMTMLRSA